MPRPRIVIQPLALIALVLAVLVFVARFSKAGRSAWPTASPESQGIDGARLR